MGRPWTLRIYKEEKYAKLFGTDSDGITCPKEREIYIREDADMLTTIVHELTHAYYSSLCTNSATLKCSQLEEIFCELVATYGEQILRVGKAIAQAVK